MSSLIDNLLRFSRHSEPMMLHILWCYSIMTIELLSRVGLNSRSYADGETHVCPPPPTTVTKYNF